MPQSFDSFDKPYRRGLVLGLSLAEVFLILLFLLLLTAIGITSALQEDLEESEAQRKILEDSLSILVDTDDNKILPQDFIRLVKEVESLRRKVGEAGILIDQLSTERGRTPPCWFREVADSSSELPSKRQKDVKIFDIKIEDDGFYVLKHQNFEKDINYGDKSGLPNFPNTLFDKKLSATELQNGFSPFYRAGYKSLIQTYKCAFTVDLYDNTSKTNKEGYKRSLKIVKGMFTPFLETGIWPKK